MGLDYFIVFGVNFIGKVFALLCTATESLMKDCIEMPYINKTFYINHFGAQ